MRVLTGVLVLSSLMGKIETNITVIYPGILGIPILAQQVVLGRL